MPFITDKKNCLTHERTTSDACEDSSRPCQNERQGIEALLQSAKRQCRYLALVMPALLTVLISGCGSVDLKRMTYDVLRQQDCLVNEFDEVCSRSFALDYYDYKQMRNSYLQSITTSEDVTLQEAVSAATAVATTLAPTSATASTPRSKRLSGTLSSVIAVPNAQRVTHSLNNLQASLQTAPSL